MTLRITCNLYTQIRGSKLPNGMDSIMSGQSSVPVFMAPEVRVSWSAEQRVRIFDTKVAADCGLNQIAAICSQAHNVQFALLR